jgi:prepilin-type N-terminal cleavage/methylation domain-containing protein
MSLRNNSGFTVIELVTVIALLGILAGIAIVSMGNPQALQSLAEAEALKANLRFTQSKAMSDLPGNLWSLNISSADYTIQRNGGAPNPVVNLPGSNSGTYTLPSGVSITAGTGLVRFNFRGQPIDALGSPLVAPLTITVYGAPSITVTQETGFIP